MFDGNSGSILKPVVAPGRTISKMFEAGNGSWQGGTPSIHHSLILAAERPLMEGIHTEHTHFLLVWPCSLSFTRMRSLSACPLISYFLNAS